MNQVILIGRICQDLQMKTNSNDPNKSFLPFTIAVSEYYNNSETTNFISCFSYGKSAENMVKYLSKGSLVCVQGRLVVNREQRNGVYETKSFVSSSKVEFLDNRNSEKTYSSSNNYSNTNNNSNIDSNDMFDYKKNTNNQVSNKDEEIVFDNDSAILWD